MSVQLPRPPQSPPVFPNDANAIIGETRHLISILRDVQDHVVATVTPETATFANVLLPIAQTENEVETRSRIVRFYAKVSPNHKLREAATEADLLFNEYDIETYLRKDIFRLIEAVFQRNESLDEESRRLLEKRRKTYLRNGMLLENEELERFKAIQPQLNQLESDFRANISKPKGSVWFSFEELDGVSDDFTADLQKGSEENQGKFKVPLEPHHAGMILGFVRHATTRRKYLLAYLNRCPENIAIFKQVVLLRDESARLLGYRSHAQFNIEQKMVGAPEIVHQFLDDLREKLKERGKQELLALTAVKRADFVSRGFESVDEPLIIGDVSFYKRLHLLQEYSVDEKQISDYFSLEPVVVKMLKTFERLFGLQFRPVESDEYPREEGMDVIWHENVQLFSVWDGIDPMQQSKDFLGYLYTDLESRDGKIQHAVNSNIQPGFLRADGTRHYPTTVLICSFEPSTSRKPSLLSHQDLKMLFHELGHGIHELVSKTKYSHFHGTSGPVDFAEGPSQMLECFCWVTSFLKNISCHYSYLSREYLESWKSQNEGTLQPTEVIGDELLNNLIRTKNVYSALSELSNLHISIFDLKIYDLKTHQQLEDFDVPLECLRLYQELIPIEDFEKLGEGNQWDHGYTNWTALMDGEYSAGYYSYLYSQIFASDIFYTFFSSDPLNPVEGKKYRYGVLEKGDSQDPMKTIMEFLGRKPDINAFFRDIEPT